MDVPNKKDPALKSKGEKNQNFLQRWKKEIDWDRRVKAVCKPCWELKYCPYGPLVEKFPLCVPPDERSCRIFGHHCPVFYVAEPFTETRELRNISRSIPRSMQFRVLKRDNQICSMCAKPVLDEDIHFDHIIPWSKGGPTEENNIRLLCADCNRKKGVKFEEDHLVSSIVEHGSYRMDSDFINLLSIFVADAHEWRAQKGHFPNGQEVCKIVGVKKKTAFEDRMAEVVTDLQTLFSGKSPSELKAKVFRALSERWGFGASGTVQKLAPVARKYSMEVSELVSAEMSLVRRLGWPVKDTSTERAKWARTQASACSRRCRMLPLIHSVTLTAQEI